MNHCFNYCKFRPKFYILLNIDFAKWNFLWPPYPGSRLKQDTVQVCMLYERELPEPVSQLTTTILHNVGKITEYSFFVEIYKIFAKIWFSRKVMQIFWFLKKFVQNLLIFAKFFVFTKIFCETFREIFVKIQNSFFVPTLVNDDLSGLLVRE